MTYIWGFTHEGVYIRLVAKFTGGNNSKIVWDKGEGVEEHPCHNT